MRHFFQYGQENCNMPHEMVSGHPERSTRERKKRRKSHERNHALNDDPDRELVDKLTNGPVIIINDAGLKLKMVCPSIAVIQRWSSALSVSVSFEKSCVLDGSYEAWQELFSHMVDETLLTHSIAHLEFDQLAELFILTRRYNISILGSIYALKIESLITEGTIIKVRLYSHNVL